MEQKPTEQEHGGQNPAPVPEQKPVPAQKKSGKLGTLFNSLTYLKNNPLQPASVLTAALLGTTALATPLLSTTIGAGALMLGSFYLLMKNSDIVVDNASSLGKKLGVSPLTLGVVLGAITSMPELFVSVGSIMHGAPELGIGNIIGSNIVNILLILGATAAITPIRPDSGLSWKFNNWAMLGTTAAFGGLMMTGVLPTIAGAGLIGGLVAYKIGSYIIAKKEMAKEGGKTLTETAKDAFSKLPTTFNTVWGLAGVGGLVCAADLLVGSATNFALGTGVSPALVAALGVALGTSLPELTVNIKAALKGETQMAVGNILGSNIFNILMVGGAVGLANTAVPATFGTGSDLGLLNLGAFGASAGLLGAALFAGKGGLKRWQGIAGIGLYGAFTAASIFLANGTGLPESPQPQVTQSLEAPAAAIASQETALHEKTVTLTAVAANNNELARAPVPALISRRFATLRQA